MTYGSLDLPLRYQREILQQVRSEDALLILAQGLSMPRIVTNLLQSYDQAGNLVILIGADSQQEAWLGEGMAELVSRDQTSRQVQGGLLPMATARRPRGLRIINTDKMGVVQRERLYSKGGVFSITSQILVVDLLTGLLDAEKITGVIVLKAEKVSISSTEAFIMRIFRQRNKTGFIKAFSDTPESFATGFAPLTRVLQSLFLRTPILMPRFHADVIESLEGQKGDVIELEIALSDSMRDIQNAILECMEACIAELKRGVPGLDLDVEDWNIDSALHREFERSIRRQLDPVWHRVSWKTRQLVSDIGLLRQLLQYVLTYDPVSFNKILDIIVTSNTKSTGSVRQHQSPWLFLDAANTIFSLARKRIFPQADAVDADGVGGLFENRDLYASLEELPKWSTLSEVLEEIEQEIHLNTVEVGVPDTTLIMCSDERTCRQLEEYLHFAKYDETEREYSGADYMRRRLRDYLGWKSTFGKVKENLMENDSAQQAVGKAGQSEQNGSSTNVRGKQPFAKRRRVRGAMSNVGRIPVTAAEADESEVNRLTSVIENSAETFDLPDDSVLESDVDYYKLLDNDSLVVILPYNGDLDDRTLEELRPRFIVMYEPDASFIRRVEVYRSTHLSSSRRLKVYFMYYKGSVEEQRYLSSVRREKDAFTRLIRERGSMALTLNDPGGILDPQEQFLRTINTRIAGGGRLKSATAEPPRIVVDLREFRSSLPNLLHGRNLTVVPCMLTVGDYIITDTMCVERKSVSDLISSLNSGRLYSQCEMMVQHYTTPLLLIEFDQSKSFSLIPLAEASSKSTGTISPTDLQTKLVLLTLAFPALKIIWSSSAYATAEIFEDLKKTHPEPDPMKAVRVGLDDLSQYGSGNSSSSMVNVASQDLLRSMPGITGKNYHNVMFEVESVQALSNLPQEDLINLLGPENGRTLYNFVNKGEP